MNQIRTAATLKDVAHAAGVSVATASRALTGSSLISVSTAARVRSCAAQLNYQPNVQARALRKSTTDSLGVIIPDITNQYFALLAAAIETAAAQSNHVVMLANTNDRAELLAQSVGILNAHGVDGIIAVPLPHTEAVFEELKEKGTPFVFVDRDLPEMVAWSVNSDPQPGISAAVRQLLSHGATTIGFLSGPPETSTGRERRAAFEAECAAQEVPHSVIFDGSFRSDAGYRGAEFMVKRGVRSMIAGDSMMTMGALSCFHDAGISVGADVDLIGFDDMLAFRLQPEPLTVIDQHVQRMGIRAVELLLAQMDPQITVEELNAARRERIPTTLYEGVAAQRRARWCAEAEDPELKS
ncbi:MAG: LacI family transcriptional regulator [Arcanobacterium sp.]|nr:LacI family transcriptional regulator [Arcanobacterium sp.]